MILRAANRRGAAREPILDIEPANADLLIEARVRPEDIGHVKTDAPADVQLTAFKRRLTPVVEDKVIYASADRLRKRRPKGQAQVTTWPTSG